MKLGMWWLCENCVFVCIYIHTHKLFNVEVGYWKAFAFSSLEDYFTKKCLLHSITFVIRKNLGIKALLALSTTAHDYCDYIQRFGPSMKRKCVSAKDDYANIHL